MKKHRKPGPATTGPGSAAKKILPLGALLAVLAWPGLASGQTLVEPPPVESFAHGAGQNAAPDADTAVMDLWNELVEEADNATVSPSVTGTPPLPPGTPAIQPTTAESSSVSGTFSPAANSGQEIEFVEPVVSPDASVDPFRQSSNQEPVNSVSSPLSPPPDSGASFPPSAPGQAESASVPLGQGATLPQPGWQSVSGALPQPPSQYISDAPEPQFDAGQSRWIQPEIGQTFSTGSTPAVTQPRPSSVPTVHTSPSEKLDAVMDVIADAPVQPGPSSVTNSAQTPEGREHLRNLFSDMTASDSLAVPTTAPPTGQGAPPVPDFSGLTAKSPPTSSSQPGPVEAYDGSSAILRAGGLLTLDSHYGAAEILPPLTGQQPLKTAAPTVESPPKQPEVQAPTPKPQTTASAPAASSSKSSKKSKAKTSGSKRASASTKTRAAAPAGGNLMIINETGNPRVGEIYQSVLTRMGHTVVSVAQGHAGGTPGQTVITYRPGYRAQAQSIARHLPGQKVLSEAKGGQVLASEVMVNIR